MEVILDEYRDTIFLLPVVLFLILPPFCCLSSFRSQRAALTGRVCFAALSLPSVRRVCVADPSAPAAAGSELQRGEDNEFDSAANLCHTFEGSVRYKVCHCAPDHCAIGVTSAARSRCDIGDSAVRLPVQPSGTSTAQSSAALGRPSAQRSFVASTLGVTRNYRPAEPPPLSPLTATALIGPDGQTSRPSRCHSSHLLRSPFVAPVRWRSLELSDTAHSRLWALRSPTCGTEPSSQSA